ncbi:unnamed protein product, partial [Rotaria sp. Silwood2]
ASCASVDFLIFDAFGPAFERKSSCTTLEFPDKQALCNAFFAPSHIRTSAPS